MNIIKNFLIDRDKNIIVSKNYLISFIDKFCNQKKYLFFLKIISNKFDIPLNNLINQSKIILFKSFINREGKFKNKFALKNIFLSSLRLIFIFFYIKFNAKNKSILQKKFDLIIDDVNQTTNHFKFLKLSKRLKTAYITNFDSKLKDFFYLMSYKNIIINNKEKISYIFFLKLFFFTALYSFKLKNNLFPFFEDFYKNYLKYDSLFSKVTSKYLLQESHFNTNEIKNYLFKKHGGKYTATTQRNILQLNGIGMFIFCDIIFTLGKKSAEDLNKLGGKVRSSVPVGSLAMEYNYYEKRKRKKNTSPAFDLLVFCSDHLGEIHSGYNSYYKDYYLHYKWIAKLAQENPNIKIGLKMKRYIKDKKVLNIFSDIKNVKFVFMKDLFFSNSYFYGEKAKVICTWSSTLAYEFFGDKKICYFVDPGNRNISFLPNKSFIKKYKLSNYDTFKKTILSSIFSRKKYNTRNNDFFCLNSRNTSQRIIKYLLSLK